MKKDEAEAFVSRQVKDEIAQRNIISFKTYFMSDYGEIALGVIVRTILEKLGRVDLLDVVYTSAKELIINATKANLKRVLFKDMNIDPADHDAYYRGINEFKDKLREEEIKKYAPRFREENYPVVTTFYFLPNVLNIKVKNLFALLPEEEKSIRFKFAKANSFVNLFDFYTEYGDETEGAGLGLAMVGILLDNLKINKHAFTLYSTAFNETAAKLEIALSDDYVSKRELFEQEREKAGMSSDEFRKIFNPKVFKPL